MALTYDDTAQLMNDGTFRGRVKVALLHFAQYIQGEAVVTPAHNTRVRWAQNTYANPDGMVGHIAPAAVMEPHIQADGAAVTDADLQTDVETAVQNFL